MEAIVDKGEHVPLLDYADFIPVSRNSVAFTIARLGMHSFLFTNLLKPSEMPIHPAIYNQPELYTEGFVDKIFQSMPESLKNDIGAVSRVLEVDLRIVENNRAFNILYHDEKVCSISQEDLRRDKFEAYPSNRRGSKEIGYEMSHSKLCSGVEADGKPHYTRVFSYPPEGHQTIDRRFYPLSRETLEAYKFKELESGRAAEFIVWHTHNTDYLARILTIRSFAILFNNLGLKELGLVKNS